MVASLMFSRTVSIAFAAFCQPCQCRHFKGKELRPGWLRWHRTSSTDLLRIVLLLAVAVEVVGIAVALFHSLIMKSVKSQFPG